MKLHTEFATPLRQTVRALLAGAWSAALLMVVACFWLAYDAAARAGESAALRDRLATLTLSQATLAADLPSLAEMAEMKRRVARLRELRGEATGSLVPLLAELENLMPPDVRLSGLQYVARDHSVDLRAEANGAESLTRFLLALEQSRRFAKVMLVRQGQQNDGGGRQVRFDIRLEARP